VLIVLAFLFLVPPQAGLKLERFRLLKLEEVFRASVAAAGVVEEQILDHRADGWIVRDALVEVVVRLVDLLDIVLDLWVEGETHIFPGVDARARVEGGVMVEGVADLLQRNLVVGTEIESEALVQLGDDLREGFELLCAAVMMLVGLNRLKLSGPALLIGFKFAL